MELNRNGVKVNLKSPGTEGIAHFLKVLGDMNKITMPSVIGKTEEEKKEIETEYFQKVFSGMTDSGREALQKLVQLALKKTYPNYTEEDDQWGMANFMTIFPMVIELCSPKDMETTKKKEVMDRVEELQAPK